MAGYELQQVKQEGTAYDPCNPNYNVFTDPPYKTAEGPKYLEAGWRANRGPQESNKSGFRATGHRILLKPFEVEKKSAGGIVLVDKTTNAEEQAAVIAVVVEIGNDCWNDKANDFCQVGDKVLIGMYTGKFHVSPVDGIKYRFVQDLDIISPIIE